MWRLSKILAGTPLSTSRLTPCKWWLGMEWLAHRLQPGKKHCQPAGKGRKLWFFTTHTHEVKTFCRKRIVPPLESLRSLPSTLGDDLLQSREHIAYCIQEPGDVVLFSFLTAHCALTGPGRAASMTTTLNFEEAEEERVQRLGAQYQLQSVRRVKRQPGSRGRSRGKDGPGFHEVRNALKLHKYTSTITHFFKNISLDVASNCTTRGLQTNSINLSTFLGNHFECYSD